VPDRSPIYSIDSFNLLLRLDLTELWELRRSQHLENYARYVKPKAVTDEERARGYRSQLEVTKFDVEILRRLSRSLRRTDYQLNLVEIACDVLSETASRTRSKSRSINKVIRKLYSPGVRLYDLDNAIDDRFNRKKKKKKKRRKESPHDRELLGDVTSYTGGKNFEYKVYARKSPATQHPAVRGEWTFKGSRTIREKTGVQTIWGLSRLNVQERFLEFYTRFIRYEEIDHEKHGRFIMKEPYNSPRLRQTPMEVRLAYSRPKTISHVYLKLHDIKNSSQLRQHYAAEKKRIEVKLRNNEPLTPLETRIAKLSRTRINSFFTPVPDPFFEAEPRDQTE
jgi:hypothetical protein